MTLFGPLLYGVGTALPLVVGAAVGVTVDVPERVEAVLLAFASGSLLTGLAFELFEPAVRTTGLAATALGLFAGTGAYVWTARRFGSGGSDRGSGLLAAVILDGVAENVTLGASLVGGAAGGPLAILVGVAANNLPEAIGGARAMRAAGRSPSRTIALWSATAAGLAGAVLAGYLAFAGLGATALALVRATGGGAVLASVAIEIMPDAYAEGGPGVAFATTAGLVVTFAVV